MTRHPADTGAPWRLALALLAAAFHAVATEYYVSAAGDDAHSGEAPDAQHALRTLQSAVDRLRPGDTCFVRGGTYCLTRPVTLGAEHSGTAEARLTIRAYGDERPVLVGGVQVSGFSAYRGSVLQADLTTLGLDDIRPTVLVFDGRRQEVARYPNRDPGDRHGGAWAHVDGQRLSMYADRPDEDGYLAAHRHLDFWQRNLPRYTRTLRPQAAERRTWSSPGLGEVSIFPRFNWSHYVLAIESQDPADGLLHLGPGSFYEIRPGDRYFVRNLLEELDTPGEWCVDGRRQRLYFWPPEPLAGRPVYLATTPHAFRLKGCSYVTIRGFTIECCTSHAVLIENSTGILVAGNTIRHTGAGEGCGIVVAGGDFNLLTGNDIHDTGNSGIRLGGGDPTHLTPGGNTADNNWIHHVGHDGRGAKGIEVTGALNRVAHNLIQHTPHYGILMWGPRHTLEYNHLRFTCLETEDAGGIGGGAIDWLSWQGAVIRYNRIEDTIGYGYDEQAGQWVSPYFTYALYPDWAASGVQIIGNLLLRAPRGCLHLHSGRDNLIENNVLVDGTVSQMDWTGWTTGTGFWSTMVDGWVKNYEAAAAQVAWQAVPSLKDPRTVPLPDGLIMSGNTFRRNIICYSAPRASLWHMKDVPLSHNTFDENILWHAGKPLRTGQFRLQAEHGPNRLANPGTEDGPAGAFPADWGWTTKASEATRADVVLGQAHGASRSLLVEPGPLPAGARTGPPVYVAPGPAIAFQPGAAYRFAVWMRAEGEPVTVSVEVYSWKQDVHSWLVAKSVSVTGEWREYELLARLPAVGEPSYKASMETLWTRLTFRPGPGRVYVDDVSLREATLMSEWEAWQAGGLDAHSRVADPLFVDPARGDYRLRPESPAFALGFQPLPLDAMGCYADPLRASWPVGP